MTETPTTEVKTVRQERKSLKSKIQLYVNCIYTGVTLLLIGAATLHYNGTFAAIQNSQSYNKVKSLFVESPTYVEPEPVPEEEPSQRDISIRNNIDIVATYIKMRNSRMPKEVRYIIAENVVREAMDTNIAIPLIMGIMEKESLFNPTAKSDKEAMGLMQILRGEDITIDKDKAFDIAYNIKTGCKILNKKLEITNGDLDKALTNYSGGAKDYTQEVMLSAGRFTLYAWKIDNQKQANRIEISMLTKE